MSADPWIDHPKGDLSILDVPFLSERNRENECLVYCLSMTTHYLAKKHPDEWVRNNVTSLPPETVRETVPLGTGGWKPDKNSLNVVGKEAGPVQFEHVLNEYSLTKESYRSILETHLEANLPVIPIINIRLLRKNVVGGVHAVVVTGMNQNQISFHDPWGYKNDLQDAEEFIKAWDDVLNQVVTVDVGRQESIGNESESPK